MQLALEQKDSTKLKHSKLGIMAFTIFISPIIPFSTVFIFRWGILSKVFKYENILFISNLFTYWFIFAPILAFVFSIIDFRKPERLKTLPRITLILSSIYIGVGIIAMIIVTISDLKRLL